MRRKTADPMQPGIQEKQWEATSVPPHATRTVTFQFKNHFYDNNKINQLEEAAI